MVIMCFLTSSSFALVCCRSPNNNDDYLQVQSNLVTTCMTGGGHAPGPGHPDSLLNPNNR